MRYAVFAGGKRLRPALVVLAGEARRGRACRPAVEAPIGGRAASTPTASSTTTCRRLDDDDLRRGRPTAHRAVRRGDRDPRRRRAADARPDPPRPRRRRRSRARCARGPSPLVGEALGTGGMIGGQVEDLEAERGLAGRRAGRARPHPPRQDRGAARPPACAWAALYAGVPPDVDARLAALGERLGLMFQIARRYARRRGRRPASWARPPARTPAAGS